MGSGVAVQSCAASCRHHDSAVKPSQKIFKGRIAEASSGRRSPPSAGQRGQARGAPESTASSDLVGGCRMAPGHNQGTRRSERRQTLRELSTGEESRRMFASLAALGRWSWSLPPPLAAGPGGRGSVSSAPDVQHYPYRQVRDRPRFIVICAGGVTRPNHAQARNLDVAFLRFPQVGLGLPSQCPLIGGVELRPGWCKAASHQAATQRAAGGSPTHVLHRALTAAPCSPWLRPPRSLLANVSLPSPRPAHPCSAAER